MILLNDFKKRWAEIEKDVLRAVTDVGSSGWYVLGQGVEGFEQKLAKLWGTKYALGCGNGMDAIEIALRGLGLRTGEKVLTTPLSAFATTLAILRAGGTPVFVDTDENGLIDLGLAEEALIKDRSIRFFVPVHLYGQLVDLAGLETLKNKYSLFLIEDAAQSILARQSGFSKGFVGDAITTSFYPTKNLGALGDGGAMLTSNQELLEKARAIRDYGQTAKYQHTVLGLNSRLDELQAVILNQAILPRIEHWTAKRRAIAVRYMAEIRNEKIKLLKVENVGDSCWHLFPIFTAKREELMGWLKQNEIQSAIHYPSLITEQGALKGLVVEGGADVAIAKRLCSTTLSLPCHPQMTDQEVEFVIRAVNQFQ